MTLTDAQQLTIFNDFVEWSGGWAPCSEGQILEYMESSYPFPAIDEDEAIAYLKSEIMES